MVVNYYSSY